MIYAEKTDNMADLFPKPPVLKGTDLILRPLVLPDTEDLRKLTGEDAVYRYLPTFLFEKKYDAAEVIRRLYDECLKDSLILGHSGKSAFAVWLKYTGTGLRSGK